MSNTPQEHADYIDERQIGTRLVQSAIERFLAGAEAIVRKKWAAYKNKGDDAFSTYLAARQRRAGQIRNFIYDIKSASLEDIYVPPDVENTLHTYNESDFLTYLNTEKPNLGQPAWRPYPAIVIVGRAGIGKSLLAQRLFLEQCRKFGERIPILIELRDLNGIERMSLPHIIATEIDVYDATILPEQIKIGLENGLFTLIMDGQDEIDKENEDHYSRIFVDAARRYPRCPIIITGRPSLEVVTWSDFETFNILPMSKEKTVDIITKLEFDEITKLNFIDALRSGLYETHQEMLNIPLLAIVMLLTFSDTGDISDTLHEFYEDAFSALWRRHDAKKEGFQRRLYSKLGRKEFSDLVSAFAASTYIRSTFSFRDDVYARHVSNAMKLTSTKVDIDHFKRDLIRSTSLCIVDGSAISFCHRTFHEYFVALFVLHLPDSQMTKALEVISDRFETDYVIDLLLSMDEQRVIRNWVIPRLQQLVPRLKEVSKDCRRYLQMANRGEFRDLVWLRLKYDCDPSSGEIAAAADAMQEMIKSFGTEAVRGNEGELEALVSKDVTSLSELLDALEREQEGFFKVQLDVFGSP